LAEIVFIEILNRRELDIICVAMIGCIIMYDYYQLLLIGKYTLIRACEKDFYFIMLSFNIATNVLPQCLLQIFINQ